MKKFIKPLLLFIVCACLMSLVACIVIGAPKAETFVELTPAPAPTPTPKPTPSPKPVPTMPPLPTPSPSTSTPDASPTKQEPAAIILGDKRLYVLSSFEEAQGALNSVLDYYSELAIGENGGILVSAKFVDEPIIKASDRKVDSDRQSVVEKLTGKNSKLKVSVVIETTKEEIKKRNVETVEDKNLLEGTRIVNVLGRDGEASVKYQTEYINGKPGKPKKVDDVATIQSIQMKLTVGKERGKNQSNPGKSEGGACPDPGILEFMYPISAKITRNFGSIKGGYHYGIDFLPKGETSVVASEGGTVVAAFEYGAYGMMVEIAHGNGFITRYATLDDVAVSYGDTLKKGDPLGSISREKGTLHFEILHGSRPFNPRYYLK